MLSVLEVSMVGLGDRVLMADLIGRIRVLYLPYCIDWWTGVGGWSISFGSCCLTCSYFITSRYYMGLVVLSNNVSIRGYSKLTLLVWTFFASINVPLHLRRDPSIRLCCLIVESSRPEHLMSYVQPSPSLRQEHLPSDNQHKPYPQKANFGVHSILSRLAICLHRLWALCSPGRYFWASWLLAALNCSYPNANGF